MNLENWKSKIKKSWAEMPQGWETHVQNVYVSYYSLRQDKVKKDDRPRHWQQYLDQ